MRRMLSDAKVKEFENKQDKLTAGYNINISSDNVISAGKTSYELLKYDSTSLAAEGERTYTDVKLQNIGNVLLLSIIAEFGGKKYATALCGNVFSDIDATVSIILPDGQLDITFKESETVVVNNTETAMSSIYIYRLI